MRQYRLCKFTLACIPEAQIRDARFLHNKISAQSNAQYAKTITLL